MIQSILLGLIFGSVTTYQAPTTTQIQATVTAYTSDPAETDDNPLETASGTVPGPGTIACPSRWPFGTRVEIEGQMYTCEDRMNKRYRETEHYDVWLASKDEAWEWGRREMTILVHK